MEKVYIGTKIIAVEPMNEAVYRGIYNKGIDSIFTGDKIREGYKFRYEDGYISWSHKETFERAYREVTPEEAGLIAI